MISLLLCVVGSGCASTRTPNLPDRKDLAVLNAGVSRSRVLAELGTPVWSEIDDGRRVDIFSFKQALSGGETGRAMVHSVAAMWAIVIPQEKVDSGQPVQVEVRYDENQYVEAVKVFAGEELVEAAQMDGPLVVNTDDIRAPVASTESKP